MKKKKLAIYTIGSLVILGSAYYGYTKFFGADDNTGANTSSESVVTKGDFVDAIKVTGTAKLAYEQKLKFLQSGKVTQVLVKAGDSVKKGQLLASLDTAEFNESIIQAQDRVKATEQKLTTARNKLGGVNMQKLQAELSSLESKKALSEQELQKLIQTAPMRSETKKLEREQKKSELASKEAAYNLDYKVWENDVKNKATLIAKKITEAKKVIDTVLQSASTDISDLRTLRHNINKLFGFDRNQLADSERSRTDIIAWNDTSLRNQVGGTWRDLDQKITDLQKFLDNSSSFNGTRQDLALAMNAKFIEADQLAIDLLDRTRKAIDATSPVESITNSTELEGFRSTVNGYRSTVQSRITTRRENQSLLPLISSDTLIGAQVEKELAEKKLALDAQKLALEKLRVEIVEGETQAQAGGTYDITVKRDIDAKKQELLDTEVSIISKRQEIDKNLGGKTDEIISLESELKNGRSELRKMALKKEQYEIRAPISGVIRTVKMFVGDNIGSSTTSGNDGTIVIQDSSAVVVSVKLNQKDIVRVKQNQEAIITLDTFSGAKFTGKVAEISSSPDEGTSGAETTYEIQIVFSRGEYAIYSGMSANVVINLGKRSDTLFVPITSVSRDPATDNMMVTVMKEDGTTEKRPVKTGLSQGDRIEIISGLKEGDKVMTIDFNATNFNTPEPGMGMF